VKKAIIYLLLCEADFLLHLAGDSQSVDPDTPGASILLQGVSVQFELAVFLLLISSLSFLLAFSVASGMAFRLAILAWGTFHSRQLLKDVLRLLVEPGLELLVGCSYYQLPVCTYRWLSC
jgi:hypothetical protein